MDALLVVSRWVADVGMEHIPTRRSIYRPLDQDSHILRQGMRHSEGDMPEVYTPHIPRSPTQSTPFRWSNQPHNHARRARSTIRRPSSNPTRTVKQKRTHSTSVVHLLDHLICYYHIPVVGPIDDAGSPTHENHAEENRRDEWMLAKNTEYLSPSL